MPVDYGKNIYHFTKFETALLYILPSKKLKLTSFLESNDPKENKTFGFWSILLTVDDSEQFTIKQAFKDFLHKNCKQLCFSQDYVKKGFYVAGYKHPTMWAHYASNSKGICLVIDREKFLEENSNLICGKITYKAILNFPSIDCEKWKREDDNYLRKFVTKNAKNLFFQKHYHWAVEHELKFVEIGPQKYCSIENSLIGLYLGPDFDNSLTELIYNAMIPNKGQIDQVYVNDGEYYTRRIDDPDDDL